MEQLSTALRVLGLFFQMSTVTDDCLVGGHENPPVTQKKVTVTFFNLLQINLSASNYKLGFSTAAKLAFNQLSEKQQILSIKKLFQIRSIAQTLISPGNNYASGIQSFFFEELSKIQEFQFFYQHLQYKNSIQAAT